MISFRDKCFCASAKCINECNRKMTEEEKKQLAALPEWAQVVSYAYFCGGPENE